MHVVRRHTRFRIDNISYSYLYKNKQVNGMKTCPRDMILQWVARGMFKTDLHGVNLGQILRNGMIQMYNC